MKSTFVYIHGAHMFWLFAKMINMLPVWTLKRLSVALLTSFSQDFKITYIYFQVIIVDLLWSLFL